MEDKNIDLTEGTARPDGPEEQDRQVLDEYDEQGRRVYNEYGEKIHWATPRDRIVAGVLALVVVVITIAMAYSISVGDFFRW